MARPKGKSNHGDPPIAGRPPVAIGAAARLRDIRRADWFGRFYVVAGVAMAMAGRGAAPGPAVSSALWCFAIAAPMHVAMPGIQAIAAGHRGDTVAWRARRCILSSLVVLAVLVSVAMVLTGVG